MNVNIRRMRPDEAGLLREFLYQAIYLPAGTEPPPRSVVDLPELRVYTENFGTRPGDFCLVAEVDGQVVGAAWSRIMEDYGHIDNDTPSLALSLLPDCRGQGIGTRLLNGLLALLQNQGYQRASLSVQIENPALRLYQRAGFEIAEPRGSEYLMVRDFTQPVQQEDINMEIRLAQSRDIDAWMALVEQVRDQFPGLETSKAMEEHRATVLDFIRQSSAICAAEAGQIVGALLFSRERSSVHCCFPGKAVCSAFWRWTRPAGGSTLPGRWFTSCCLLWRKGGTLLLPPIGKEIPTGPQPGPSTSSWALRKAG